MNGSSSNQNGVGIQVRGLRKSFDGQEVLRAWISTSIRGRSS